MSNKENFSPGFCRLCVHAIDHIMAGDDSETQREVLLALFHAACSESREVLEQVLMVTKEVVAAWPSPENDTEKDHEDRQKIEAMVAKMEQQLQQM